MKKYIKFLGGLGIILMLMSFAMSEFYSSLTKIDYIEGSKTLKFTTKLNTRHISNAIKINPNTANFEAELNKYISKNFNVNVNGTSKNITFTGTQINGESVWVYFESQGIEQISNLKIKNTILLETYPKQLNLANISYKGSQKNMTFQRGKEIVEVSF
ncbi:MAG: M penetrans family 1 protein [Flavobacteriaceae bacterium]|nr:M penetrans family 1 protein [Flavobacteriaceae bacterium]